MRILWHSNAPWAGSGYGVQTDIFTRLMTQDGHEVVISAFFGLQAGKLNNGNYVVLPGSFHAYGDDILPHHWERIQPDVTVSLIDAWVFTPEQLAKAAVTTWVPIDHEPLPPAVANILPHFKHQWAMSRHGEKQMRMIGLKPYYVPHGVDMDWYKPMDRSEARRQLNVDEKLFFAVSCAANKGFPPRKNIDKLIKAFSAFVRKHPDSALYLHTLPLPVHGGMDVYAAREFYGLSDKQLLLPDIYRMNMGEYTPQYLNLLYNAADVFVLPSAGEGFGVPIVEAQAAGCPVIVSDLTAMSELGAAGYKIPVDPLDGLEWTGQNSEQANVLPSQIVTALEWALARRGDSKLREAAREFAGNYDHKKVYRDYMLPAMKHIAEARRDEQERIDTRPARTEQRLALRKSIHPLPELKIIQPVREAAL